jgi:DNA-binding MarR family transcriptional regulator
MLSVSIMKGDAGASPRVSYLVKWLERGIRTRLDAALGSHGVSTPEYTALSVLARRDGLSSAQLARRTLVTAQAMNQLVIALEKRRLIVRRADPDHGRIQRASLTPAGRRLLAECDSATDDIDDLLLSGLSPAQAAEFRRVLARCVAALQPDFDTRRRDPEVVSSNESAS